MRFTLVKMFVAVTMVALACAGLIYRTSLWASIVVTLTVTLYAVVAMRSCGFSGAKRASAMAFSLAGVAYLLLATCSLFTGIRELLLTNYPIAFAAQQAASKNPFAFSDATWASYPPGYSLPSMAYSSYVPPTTGTFAPIPPPVSTPTSVTPSETPSETPDTSDPAANRSDTGVSRLDDGSTPPTLAQPSAISTTTGSISVSPYIPAGTLMYGAPIASNQSSTALLDAFIASSAMNSAGTAIGRFFLIGHCVWSWLFALVAAWFAGRIYARRELLQANAA